MLESMLPRLWVDPSSRHYDRLARPGASLVALDTDTLREWLARDEIDEPSLTQGECLEDPLRDGLILVVNADLESEMADRSNGLAALLQNAYLGRWTSAPRARLNLLSKTSLWDALLLAQAIVPEKAESTQDPAWLEWLAEKVPAGSSCCEMVWVCDFQMGSRPEEICGEPGCYSDYAWAREGIILAYVRTSACRVLTLEVFPRGGSGPRGEEPM
jgi:hypothetical protein